MVPSRLGTAKSRRVAAPLWSGALYSAARQRQHGASHRIEDATMLLRTFVLATLPLTLASGAQAGDSIEKLDGRSVQSLDGAMRLFLRHIE
jgi:hypothetical protein